MTANEQTLAPLIVVSGPSGSGKSTIVRRVLAMNRWPLRLSVSVTTRAPRPGEQNGVHYHFWTRNEFVEEIARDGFLEHADVFGSYYGTLKREVDPHRLQGVGVLLEVDVQGWDQVRGRRPEVVCLFVRTSSLAAYEERLRRRGTESEEALQRRLQGAITELARADEYDYQIINDDLDEAVQQTKQILDDIFQRNENAG